MVVLDHVTELRAGVRADAATGFTDAAVFVLPALELKVEPFLGVLLRESVLLELRGRRRKGEAVGLNDD